MKSDILKLSTALPVILCLMFALQRCSNRPEVVARPELDTSLYSKYIVKGPDTNLYPQHQWVSSQRFPLDKYGLQHAFDGDPKTWWCSQAGLNYGEGLALSFEPLDISAVQIDIANDFTVAKVSAVKVFINDSLYGIFPSGTRVAVNEKLQKLTLIAADAEGLNEVKLPIENDSTTAFKTVYSILKTRYNSRSFGIAEVSLYGPEGRKLPLQPIPYRNATVIPAQISYPADRYYLFDGDPATGAVWTEANGQGKCILNFDDYAPVTRLRIVAGITGFESVQPIARMGISISGKDEFMFTLKPGENTIDLPEPMVAKLFTFTVHEFAPGAALGSVAELYAWDGAKWYSVVADSTAERIPVLTDTMAATPLHFVLDNRVYYSARKLELITDTFRLPNYENVSPDHMRTDETVDNDVLFRTNQTMEFNSRRMLMTYGARPSARLETHSLYGYWRLVLRSPEKVKLEIRGWDHSSVSIDGKPGRQMKQPFLREITLEGNYLDMGEGYGRMLITY